MCRETLSAMYFTFFPQSISRKCSSYIAKLSNEKKAAIFIEIYLRYYIAEYAFLYFSCSFYTILHKCLTIKEFKQKESNALKVNK